MKTIILYEYMVYTHMAVPSWYDDFVAVGRQRVSAHLKSKVCVVYKLLYEGSVFMAEGSGTRPM